MTQIIQDDIKNINEAYLILEEYACLLVGDASENSIISYANKLYKDAYSKKDDDIIVKLIEAYEILEEYVSNIVGDSDNDTLIYTNSIVQIVINKFNYIN